MDNKEISEIILRDPQAKRVFRGVFPRDTLPRKRGIESKRRSVYIINTDHSGGPGEHWVALWFDGNNRAEYFDSFGLPPAHVTIKNFIDRNSVYPVKYNQRLFQSLTSSVCGVYVLYYVLMKSRGATLGRIQQWFKTNNLFGNDRRVRSLVTQITKSHKRLF